MSIQKPLLEVKNLTVTFKSQEGLVNAVRGLDFHLNEKETLGIVGESGSGKSVTSLAIMGLIPNPPGQISEGEIFYNSQDLLKMNERELRTLRGDDISMIFQEPMTSLNPILNCGYQISESLRLHRGLSKKEAIHEAVSLLDSVGIPNPEKGISRYPHELSGGMRQRVMIAMALACEPKILIADEPTTALDVTIQAQILDLMKKLRKEKNTSIIMITHDLGVVSEVADRIMVMYAGQSVELAPTDEIFSKPLHPYTSGLIDSIPEITKERKALKEIPGLVSDPTETQKGCFFQPRCTTSMEKCSECNPPMMTIADNHFVRCWLYEEDHE
ncbi:ABC transporter ATP-binding protein [Oceanispirochaeta sp.]|jgi:oligopeptide/dipeptide ABC transporter ATP-binding protein|uniref:ABC transporter ATP-binding protein n=1 Tax=Oceanispirochaeta sp. TaxID=2035350 RepID=UPI0026020DBB|nr:ABC transporter ATP-binding protein [Oceanispirochaeta sp.]MDA3957285.1 ABC transporter ATP-binding protein [Oceanispirochaeta sp.]